jgi:hypothetical protein
MADVQLSPFWSRPKKKSSTSSAILKFSGLVPGGEGTVTSFLTDGGPDTEAASTPPRYPFGEKFKIGVLTCNLLDGATPPPGGLVICQVVKNGTPIPNFAVTYKPGQTGILMTLSKGTKFRPGDTLGLAMIATGFSGSVGSVSAMLAPGNGLGGLCSECKDICHRCFSGGGFCGVNSDGGCGCACLGGTNSGEGRAS